MIRYKTVQVIYNNYEKNIQKLLINTCGMIDGQYAETVKLFNKCA